MALRYDHGVSHASSMLWDICTAGWTVLDKFPFYSWVRFLAQPKKQQCQQHQLKALRHWWQHTCTGPANLNWYLLMDLPKHIKWNRWCKMLLSLFNWHDKYLRASLKSPYLCSIQQYSLHCLLPDTVSVLACKSNKHNNCMPG